MKYVEVSLAFVLLAALLGAATYAQDQRPSWTRTFCQTEECVSLTLTNLMTPEVALKAKVVPYVFGGTTKGYILFYPSR